MNHLTIFLISIGIIFFGCTEEKKTSGTPKPTPAVQKKEDPKSAEAKPIDMKTPQNADESVEMTDADADEKNADISADIEGTWESDCAAIFDDSSSELGSSNSIVVLTTSTYSISNNYYTDAKCNSLASVSKSSGKLVLGDKDGKDGLPFEADESESTVKIVTAEEAVYANEFSNCGFTDWKAGDQRDVLGTECAASGTVYNRISLTEKGLFFGLFTDDLDGTSEGKRPTSIDTDPIYRKK